VTKLGIVPTPVLAYLTMKHGFDCGVMITASHNPPQYNGIKIFDKEGVALSMEKAEEIEQIIENQGFKLARWNGIGKCQETSHLIDDYIELVIENLSFEKSWHVVIDPGCGATSVLAPLIFRKLGCEVRG